MGEKMKKTDTDILISMAMDMMNDKDTDNAQIVRACIFAACIISISHKVELDKIQEIVGILYRRISISIGYDSMFPPAES